MPEAVAPGLWPLGLAAAILVFAGVGGHGEVLLRRIPGVGPERARTWAMSTALGATAGACVIAAGVSIWRLAVCGGGSEAPACAPTLLVAALPAPVEGLPSLDLTVRVDGIAAIFLLVVGICGACVAVYSFGWLRDDPLRHSVAASSGLFVLATLLTVMVDNAFWLFIALELMTLCSADLVRYRGRIGGPDAASRTAVRTYLIVGHVGIMCLVAGLLPIAVKHSTLDLDVLRGAGGSPVPAVSFALVLLGLGIRAGVTPFHFWVPIVHPQLPTNTHAMMSAVMLKIPVYLMVRFFFEGVIGPITWWWGAVLLILAGVTALITVFYAVLSTDLKVALAYHSVENVGIILAGLGLALLFSDARFGPTPAIRGAAAIALVASLYHVVNHALFKSLLFLGAGSIEKRTGTLDVRALGGLIRRLPWTAVPFLVGALAITGLPPLNGFISEWLTLQSLFGGQAAYRTQAPIALSMMAALAVTLVTLALAFALTALAFVKIVGESLLGECRGPETSRTESWSTRGVMVVLAAVCLLLGLQPWLLVPWLETAIAPLNYDVSSLTATPTTFSIELPEAGESVGPYRAALPIVPLLVLVGLPILLTVLLRTWRWARRPVWVGGRLFEPRTMQYQGNALSALLWEPVSRQPSTLPDGPFPASISLSPRRMVVEATNYVYNGLIVRITQSSQRFGDRLQNGDVRSYLLYIFGTVVVVLAVLAVTR